MWQAGDSPLFFLGENKPIWMHAEEREESKVSSAVSRASKCAEGVRLGCMELPN